jgi:hypothetical protein
VGAIVAGNLDTERGISPGRIMGVTLSREKRRRPPSLPGASLAFVSDLSHVFYLPLELFQDVLPCRVFPYVHYAVDLLK